MVNDRVNDMVNVIVNHTTTMECSSCTLPMKTFTSRCHTFCGISITEEKGNGRFACKSPTWIIIKKNHPLAHRAVKHGEKETSENRPGRTMFGN